MRGKNLVKIFTLSFLTCILLYLSFPPLDLGFLAWAAFIPWFILIATEEKYPYLTALFIGAVFFFIHLSWLRYVTVAAWILLSLYCTAYFLLFTLSTRFIIFKLKLPLVIVAPFLWTTLEFIRSFFLSGFPWFFIGHTQYRYLPVIQISDITGVYGISFVIITVNACIADLVIYYASYRKIIPSESPLNPSLEKGESHLPGKWLFIRRYSHCLFPTRKRLFLGFACIFPAVLIAAMLSYGLWWLTRYTPQEGPTICMVQGNILQDLKFQPTDEDQVRILKTYSDLSMSVKGKPIDLLIWPETMVPGILNIDPALTGRMIDTLSQHTVLQLAHDLNTNLLLGGIALAFRGEEQMYFNSAFYYNRKGELVDRYDKVHLVPFGEYTPLKDYFPFLASLVPYEIGLTHGQNHILFPLDTVKNGNFTFGSSICYEDTVAPLVRKFKKNGADFIVNITNDGWFRDSTELDQHLATMVFRAVENRVCMARAANTGISSFISPDGAIYAKLTDSQGKYREIRGTLLNRVRYIEKYNTVYTLYGDYFAFGCMTVFGIMICIAGIKKEFPLDNL